MKAFLLAAISLSSLTVAAQNVGIGNTTPETPLHVTSATDTNVLILESGSLLTSGKSAGLIFKTNTYYTGGLRAFGVNTGAARLGLFSGTSSTINGIQERISIANDGNIGIGTITPQSKLDVNGTGYFQNIGGSTTAAAVKGYSSVDSRYAPGVVGTGTSIGTLGNSSTVNGIGVFGYNNLNNSTIPYVAGVGVLGFSSAGHGVAGTTEKPGASGVFGFSNLANSWGCSFLGASGGSAGALFTVGPVRFAALNEGAGKVLTSDIDGNATWQTPEKVSFSAYLPTSFPAVSDSYYKLSGLTTEFEYGNSFNAVNGIFTAPSDGVYQFTARIGFETSGTNPIYTSVNFRKNGTDFIGGKFSHVIVPVSNNWYESLNYTKTIKLVTGQQVSVFFILRQTGTSTLNISGNDNTSNACFFSGVKLH